MISSDLELAVYKQRARAFLAALTVLWMEQETGEADQSKAAVGGAREEQPSEKGRVERRCHHLGSDPDLQQNNTQLQNAKYECRYWHIWRDPPVHLEKWKKHLSPAASQC